MRKYELMLIVIPSLSPQVHEELQGKVKGALEETEGEFLSWSLWRQNSKFAYPLVSRGAERRKFTEGSYILVEFSGNNKSINRLKYVLDLEERVLRYLFIRRS